MNQKQLDELREVAEKANAQDPRTTDPDELTWFPPKAILALLDHIEKQQAVVEALHTMQEDMADRCRIGDNEYFDMDDLVPVFEALENLDD